MIINSEIIKSLGHEPKIGVYDAVLGNKYRVVVPYLNKFYAPFWFQFCKDGSFYCGVRDKEAAKYEPEIVDKQNGKYSISLDNILPLSVSKDRFSFHGSGEIHDPKIGHNTYRSPISEVTKQSELFRVFFKDLSKFEPIKQARKTDLCVLSDIPEGHMLTMIALVSPKDKLESVRINDGQNNYTAILNYGEISSNRSYCIQLCFSPNLNFGVPDKTVLVWPTIESFTDGG